MVNLIFGLQTILAASALDKILPLGMHSFSTTLANIYIYKNLKSVGFGWLFHCDLKLTNKRIKVSTNLRHKDFRLFVLRHDQTNPLGFRNRVDWRALVKD